MGTGVRVVAWGGGKYLEGAEEGQTIPQDKEERSEVHNDCRPQGQTDEHGGSLGPGEQPRGLLGGPG